MAKNLDAIKALAQVLLDTEDDIAGKTVAEVIEYLAENYTPPTGDGAPGADGADGATWLSGAGAPDNGDGNNGDFYLDTETGNVYTKESDIWGITANIKGDDGDPGDTGATGPAGPDKIRAKKITLNGNDYTPVAFQDDSAAEVTSANAETYDLTGVGDGGTIVLTPDALAEQTATINFAAGSSVSGASPATDITGETDNAFMISVDGDEAELVELTIGVGLDGGAAIATEMQSKIQALGGNKATVTVDYNVSNAGKYTVKSPTLGTSSAVVITPASSGSLTEELKIGTADGGVETAGTGDVADASAATAAELAAVCSADMEGVTADGSSGSLKLTSDTDGKDSKIVIGAGTLNAVIGLTEANEYYGEQGLGYDSDMTDALYQVVATLNGATTLTGRVLSVTNRTTAGFRVYCGAAGATDDVDLMIYGDAAA